MLKVVGLNPVNVKTPPDQAIFKGGLVVKDQSC